jgi:hypothetical protein
MTEKETWTDRHKIPSPTDGAAKPTDTPAVDWAGFKNGVNSRIGDLFKTEAGLPNHAKEIQNNLNRIDKAVNEGDLDKVVAKTLTLELYKNCAKAARAAKLAKWAKFTFKVAAAGQWFECEKVDGVIKIKGA